MIALAIVAIAMILLGVVFSFGKKYGFRELGILEILIGSFSLIGLCYKNIFFGTLSIVGFGILAIGIYFSNILKNKRCTVVVDGICERFEICGSYRTLTYQPIFRYSYEGNEFHQGIPESYAEKYNPYVKKKKYKLRINPLEPSECVRDKYIPTENKAVLIFGIVVILLWILIAIGAACGIVSMKW